MLLVITENFLVTCACLLLFESLGLPSTIADTFHDTDAALFNTTTTLMAKRWIQMVFRILAHINRDLLLYSILYRPGIQFHTSSV